MQYSFNTWVYGSFPVWLPSYPLDEVIRPLAAIGHDGIEIGCAAPHAWPAYLSQTRRNEIRSLLDGEGIAVSSLLPAPGGGPGCNPASPLVEERRFTVSHYKEVIDLAVDLGSPLVLYIGGWQVFGTSRQDAWAYSLECLKDIAAYANERHVLVAVEPTPADSNLVESVDDALEMMRAAECPNVKVMFDSFHVNCRSEVPADYVRQMGKDLAHVHFAHADRLAPQEGHIDYQSVMRELNAVDYSGYVTMETGFHARTSDPDQIASDALRYRKAVESSLDR
jgi:protein FrlC